MAGELRVLFLFILICKGPEYVAGESEDLAVQNMVRLLMGRIVGVALLTCVGLAPESIYSSYRLVWSVIRSEKRADRLGGH